MGFGASLLRTVYRLSGVKKAFALPEDRLLKSIEKANRGRGFFLPSDHKAYYEKKMIGGFPCLVVRAEEKPAKRAVLFFFGAGCDVWFPIYPLCTEYCITESYDMAFECYRQMVALYGGGNVSTCGFSSGGALALGIAAHNSALGAPLPQPRHIIAVSPGEVPWNDEERARMQVLNPRDVAIDYAFMEKGAKLMRHGRAGVPDYMLSPSRGDFSGVGDIHFYYSTDEVLYGALPEFERACARAHVPHTVTARQGMVHCYCMLPYYKEAKEDFAKIVEILKKEETIR